MSGRPFVYCLNTSTIRPTPLLEKIKVAGNAGYEAIEPWNDEVDAYLAQGGSLFELRSALSDAGLKVVSMIALHGWINSDGLAHTRCLEDCRRRMDQASFLGSPYIVASPPREAVDIPMAVTRFAELLAMGKTAGVEPSMEFLGFVDGIKSVESALAIAEGSGVPGATVVADVFHMIRGGGGVDANTPRPLSSAAFAISVDTSYPRRGTSAVTIPIECSTNMRMRSTFAVMPVTHRSRNTRQAFRNMSMLRNNR